MKKIILALITLALILAPTGIYGARYAGPLIGYILLRVETNGEAWYVYPGDSQAYYLGRPADAFKIMQRLALGVKHDFISGTEIFPDRLAGLILLDAEKNGEAYYIYPRDKKKYYLGRPADAFKIMRQLGQGITDRNLADIPTAEIGEPKAVLDNSRPAFIDNVPFTSQAPFGDWADSYQQNGCEEASALMAVKWARGQSLTKAEALEEIIKIADWLVAKHGESRDTSSKDTLGWIIKDYFGHDQAVLIKNITVNDIIEELAKGNLVIVPMNGQILHNPNYKQPGPPRHMIVIRGYNPIKKEFITNDSGTRKGELYRYDAALLYEAIRDYPTGYHEIIDQIEKNMIVVSPAD